MVKKSSEIPTPPTAYIHRTKPERIVWKDPTPKVVPGLAPSIAVMLARAKNGIPANVATRTLESYFRNKDLTDVQQMGIAYQNLKAEIDRKNQGLNELRKKAAEKKAADHKAILEYIEQTKKAASPAGPTS